MIFENYLRNRRRREKRNSYGTIAPESERADFNFPISILRTSHFILAAIAAACRDFAEGDVGAGKGTVCFGLKGGIGSASRVLEVGDRTCTLGVLVQTNFGCVENLRMDGLPVGRAVVSYLEQERATAEKAAGKSAADESASDGSAAEGTAITGQDDIGSIMIIVGTDLPVSELQLGRIPRRATVGLARTGSHIGHGSGDVVIGFTTANRRGDDRGGEIRRIEILNDGKLENAFRAVAECTEEAIYNSMVAADTVTGLNSREERKTVRALNEFWPEALRRAIADCGKDDCVYFPKGVYLTGALDLHSDMELYLDEGRREGRIVLTEGKYHQIKRMIASRDNRVTSLERISFGGIPLDKSLARGEWRYLTDEEISLLEKQA